MPQGVPISSTPLSSSEGSNESLPRPPSSRLLQLIPESGMRLYSLRQHGPLDASPRGDKRENFFQKLAGIGKISIFAAENIFKVQIRLLDFWTFEFIQVSILIEIVVNNYNYYNNYIY